MSLGLFSRVPREPEREKVEAALASPALYPYQLDGIVGPNTPSHSLVHIAADILGAVDFLPVTRLEAMQIPAVAKARALVCGTIAGLQLKAYKDGTALDNQPAWLYRTDTGESPQHRLDAIADDLFFYGVSLLFVSRGAQGQVTDALHIAVERWETDAHGVTKIDGNVIDADNLVFIRSFGGGGLLAYAARTIRAARDMENTRAARLRNPSPTVEIHLTENDALEDSEIEDLVAAWNKARNAPNGAVAVTPHNVEIRDHGSTPTDLFIEAANAVSVQVAQFTNIPATLLDASVAAGASLNYQNMAQERSWWIDTSLSYWTGPIAARLSLDDCTPRGTYIAFDFGPLTTVPQPPNPVLED